MGQPGARLPGKPPVETDEETPSPILPHERFEAEALKPYAVEVHRIERNAIGLERPQATEAARRRAKPIDEPAEPSATLDFEEGEVGPAPVLAEKKF